MKEFCWVGKFIFTFLHLDLVTILMLRYIYPCTDLFVMHYVYSVLCSLTDRSILFDICYKYTFVLFWKCNKSKHCLLSISTEIHKQIHKITIGINNSVNVKDFQCLQWFHTSHYITIWLMAKNIFHNFN